jgi:hypothetical protein
MDITSDKENLIVKIPRFQNSYDAIGELIGKTNNLIGIIAGDEFTISQLIDLGYKGTQQEGMPILHFSSRKELEKVCKKYKIDIWEHDICARCKKVIYGCSTWSKGENICMECSWKEELTTD